jgi:hypothetical protein
MNVICPNCQKNLTIPDQNAGQVMKCTLCGRDFRAPALPANPAPARSSPAAPPPGVAAPINTVPGAVDLLLGADVAPVGVPPSEPSPPGGPEVSHPTEFGRPIPAPEVAGYHRKLSLHLDPRILRWVPPAALIIVLLLTFFPWLGLYPGGKGLYVQNGWQTAFGFGSTPNAELLQTITGFDKPKLDNDVSASGALLFYLIVVLLPTVALVVLNAVSTVTPMRMPPVLERILRWRSALAVGVALLGFLLLVLQVAMGFSLENVVAQKNQQQTDEAIKTAEQNNSPGSKDPDFPDMVRNLGLTRYGLERKTPYRLAVCLHFLALVCLALELWLERRGADRPLPQVVFYW